MSIFGSIFGGTVNGLQNFIPNFGGYKTDSGTQISEWNAHTIPAVYACVGLISDAMAQLPVYVYREMPNGTRERIRGHAVEHLINRRPNHLMTAFNYRRTLTNHVLLWGMGYSEIERMGGGKPSSLWLSLPDRTYPELREDGVLIFHTTKYGRTRESKPATIEGPDMIHIPALGFDGIWGHSPVAMARQAMGLAKAMEEFGGKFYDNDARSGGYVKHPGKLSESAIERLRKSFDTQGGLDQAWRPKVLEEGMDYTPTTINPEDAQFLEGRDFQVAEIARIYRVPLHMIQSVSGSTSWGSGIAEMSMGFVRYTLSPWMNPIEQEWSQKLLTGPEREQGLYIKHDTSDLLRGDLEARSAYYTAALDPDTGWLTREEVRKAEDRNPLSQSEEQRFNASRQP